MLRITLSLTFLALGVSFSNTPHTGCNDAAPEVVQAVEPTTTGQGPFQETHARQALEATSDSTASSRLDAIGPSSR